MYKTWHLLCSVLIWTSHAFKFAVSQWRCWIKATEIKVAERQELRLCFIQQKSPPHYIPKQNTSSEEKVKCGNDNKYLVVLTVNFQSFFSLSLKFISKSKISRISIITMQFVNNSSVHYLSSSRAWPFLSICQYCPAWLTTRWQVHKLSRKTRAIPDGQSVYLHPTVFLSVFWYSLSQYHNKNI